MQELKVILLSLGLLTTSIASSHEPTLKERYARVADANSASFGNSTLAQARSVHEAYGAIKFERLTNADFAGMSDADVSLVFETENLAAFYTHDRSIAADMQKSFSELDRRKAATNSQISDLYGELAATRAFAEAEHLRATHPDANLPSLPRITEDDGAKSMKVSALFVRRGGTELFRQPVTTQASGIYVVGHPLCHFTQFAIQAIAGDPDLKRIFDEHATWIAPPSRDVEFNSFSQWNREHPDMPMSIAYRRSEWPSFDDWSTPVFYFMKNGRMVGKVVGWPRDGRKAELRHALEAMEYLH